MPAARVAAPTCPLVGAPRRGASSLQYAELAVVTMGWVVVLQVGLVLVDRFRYDVELPAAKWVAMFVALAAQAYLLLAPNGLGDAPA